MKWMVSVSEAAGPKIAETLQWGATVPTTEAWGDLARAILGGKTYGGCVLASDDDRGKTALLRALLELMDAGQQRLTVSASQYSQGIDYGALMFLVAGLPDPLTSDPGVILDGFRHQLNGSASPTILVVERPGLLDRHSSMALAQLALRRDIVLVVTCCETTELGDDLSAIWRAGELAHVELAPLTLDQAITHIEDRLGGRISRFAGNRLWRRSQGSSQALESLVDEYRRTGHLRRIQDSWVLDEGPLPSVVSNVGLGEQHMLSPAATRLLAALVESGQMGVDAVIAGGQLESLDEIFQAGLARYSTHVGIIEYTDAALIHLGEAPVVRTPTGIEPSGHKLLVARAWVALDQGETGEALRFLDGVPRPGADPNGDEGANVLVAAVEARAEAQILMGRPQTALEELSGALQAAESSSPGASLYSQMDRLRLGLARTGLRSGDLSPAAGLARGARDAKAWIQGTNAMDEGTRLSMAACLAESWTLGTRQEQGQQLNHWIMGQLAAARNEGTIHHRVRRRDLKLIGSSVLTVAILTGDWQVCRDWMAIADRLAGVAPETAMLTAVAEGLIAHNAGDTKYAIDMMMPVLRQLQHGGHDRQAEIASCIVACCLAELGRTAEAQALLAEGKCTVDGTAGMWMAEFHVALSVARLHSRAAGANRLHALADTARARGSRLLEAHALCMAMMMDESGLETRLAECAAELDGAFASAFGALAAGRGTSNTTSTATALESLVLQGFRCYGDAGLVVSFASLNVAEKRRLHRAVGDLNRRLLDTLPQARGRKELVAVNLAGPCGESLTAREREVANLVVHGLSNVQVSHRTGVSVRTVEGHLYQVYSKLQIKGRRDLVRLSAAEPVRAGAR